MRRSLPFLIAPLLAATPQEPAPVAEGELSQRASEPRRTLLPEQEIVVPADYSSGWPIVQVELDGQGPFGMILDTGAMGLVLDVDLAADLDLEVVGTARIGDPSDPEANEVERVWVGSLVLGAARFEELEAVAWERPAAMRRPGVRAILGLPVFARCLLTLDRGAGVVRLARGPLPEPDGVTVLPLERDAFGVITLSLEVAGQRVPAHLDSGNARSVVLPARLEAHVPLVPGSQGRGRGMRASGPVEFTLGVLDGELRIGGAGGIVLRRPEVRFDPELPHANLGASFLQACVPTIDQEHGRIRLAPVAAPASAPDVPGKGEDEGA